MGQRLSVCSHGLRLELPFCPLWLIVLAYGGHMEQRTYLGEISLISWSTRARDVSLRQFIDGVVCMGSYRRGDTLSDIAHRRLQNTNGLRPLRSSPFVICYGHGHRSWHQEAIRLFGLLGGRCSILTDVLGARPIHVGQASQSITKLKKRGLCDDDRRSRSLNQNQDSE